MVLSSSNFTIALVVLDTLRKDAFDEHFDWLDGVRYENAWSPSHWTVPAHGSLFTGRYATETGVHAQSPAFSYDGPILTEQLRDAGYTTRAFSANIRVSEPFRFHRGFDEFTGNWRVRSIDDDVFDWEQFIDETRDAGPLRYPHGVWKCFAGDCATLPSLKMGLMLKARDLTLGPASDDGATEALSYVQETAFGDHEFLFVNLMEAHTPYNPPKSYRTVDSPGQDGLEATLTGSTVDPEQVRTAYRDSVRYLSDIYREIHSELVKSFDYVITLADHGEMLGEYDSWEHICGLYPELTHIPLVVSGPGAAEFPDPSRRLTSLLDVHRTICDLAGIEATHSRGQSLQVTEGHDELLTEYHGLTDRRTSGLLDRGFDPALFEGFDREFNGLVEADVYAFETPAGDIEQVGDGHIQDPTGRIEAVRTGLDRRESTTEMDVSAAVERQLKNLGYK